MLPYTDEPPTDLGPVLTRPPCAPPLLVTEPRVVEWLRECWPTERLHGRWRMPGHRWQRRANAARWMQRERRRKASAGG
jgi:hypothetical protein